MKQLSLTLLLFLSLTICMGQVSNTDDSPSPPHSFVFAAIEVTAFTDYMNTVPTTISSPQGQLVTWMQELNFLTTGIIIRKNIFEFGSNNSLALSTTPTLGYGPASSPDGGRGASLGNKATGGTSFTLPLIASYNLGYLSTYVATSKIGLSIGAGIELICAPLGISNGNAYYFDSTSIAAHTTPIKTTWVEPMVKLAITFKNKGNFQLNEINFQYGQGASHTYSDGNGGTLTYRPFHFRIAFAFYIKE